MGKQRANLLEATYRRARRNNKAEVDWTGVHLDSPRRPNLLSHFHISYETELTLPLEMFPLEEVGLQSV